MKFFLTGGSGFIGTNTVIELKKRGHEICNFDHAPPAREEDRDVWVEGGIMEAEKLKAELVKFAPDVVIHYAAVTETYDHYTLEKDYLPNTQGTQNVIEAVQACPAVKRLIITSTQFVVGPDAEVKGEWDYAPHTIYGQSKIQTEELTREAELDCVWTIVRPVNIWGPYHARYTKEFWKVAAKKLYIHPNVPAPTRTYGYVGNLVWQVLELIEQPAEKVGGKAFYVGDLAIQIDRWSLGFYRAFNGHNPPKMPMFAMKMLAGCGDLISKVIGKPFFITSSRLRSMTQDYPAPVEKTEELLGKAPYSLEEGIEETVAWYREHVQKKA